MKILFFFFILFYNGYSSNSIEVYHYDLIEINHLDRKGSNDLDQIIFWDYDKHIEHPSAKHPGEVVKGTYIAHAWIMLEDHLIRKDRHKNQYYILYYDTVKHKYLKISADLFRETTTKIDPEAVSRREYPHIPRRTFKSY